MYFRQTLGRSLQIPYKQQPCQNGRYSGFIQLLSSALQTSFRNFCYQETIYKKIKNQSMKPKSQNNGEIIEISDDENELNHEFSLNNHLQNKEIVVRIQKITKDNGDSENSYFQKGSKQTQQSSCIKYCLNKEPSSKFQQPIQEQFFDDEEDDQINIFEVNCPSLGISNQQIVRKKASLLERKVNSWQDVQVNNRKQRREIRMLKK